MFGLSFGHLIIFGIIVLIFVGPEQLPEVARTIARVLNELRRATGDLQNQFTSNLDVRKWEQHLQQRGPPPGVAAQSPTPDAPAAAGSVAAASAAEEPPTSSGHGYAEPLPEELPLGSKPLCNEEDKNS